MPAGNSIIGDCAECCVCSTPTVEWDSRSASKAKSTCGFQNPNETNKFYHQKTTVRDFSCSYDYESGTETGCSGGARRDFATQTGSATRVESYSTNCTGSATDTGFIGSWDAVFGYQIYKTPPSDPSGCTACDWGLTVTFTQTVSSDGSACTIEQDKTDSVYDPCIKSYYGLSDTHLDPAPYTDPGCIIFENPPCATSTDTVTYQNLYTTTDLKSNTVAALPAYDDDWNDTAGSFANLSTNEASYSIRESRYRIRFKIPPTSVYRVTWVERFIGEAGTTITSVEVISRGVYRPTVTLSTPPSGGTQARAIAVMSSTGTISSIRITNPGSGYTSAPTVTVEAAIDGGTSSTGWTATLTDGKVTAISGGSAGDYRPTLTFSAPSGTGTTATATCTVDETGGIDAVSVTGAGSAYTAEPTLTISPKVSGPTAAVLHLHLGTETSKCIAWDGTTPGGYDPATPSTYPILPSSGYYEIAVPTTDGTTLVANVRAYCDNSSC